MIATETPVVAAEESVDQQRESLNNNDSTSKSFEQRGEHSSDRGSGRRGQPYGPRRGRGQGYAPRERGGQLEVGILLLSGYFVNKPIVSKLRNEGVLSDKPGGSWSIDLVSYRNSVHPVVIARMTRTLTKQAIRRKREPCEAATDSEVLAEVLTRRHHRVTATSRWGRSFF